MPGHFLYSSIEEKNNIEFINEEALNIFGYTSIELIKTILPDVLIKGDDYNMEEVVGADVVRASGGEVILAKTEPGFSTSNTIKKLTR